MLRGMGIEFRHRVDDPMWRSFFDAVFAVSSALLAVFFGAALGNVIRGVPLNAQGFFFNPLWTDWRTGGQTGILDWYTVLAGIMALAALAFHGANYIAVKTTAHVYQRATRVAAALWWPVVALSITMLFATVYVRPHVLGNFQEHPWGLVIPLVVFGALVAMPLLRGRHHDQAVFLASAVYLAAMLGGAAFALYPNVLPATTGSAFSLTIYNTAAAEHGLRVGVVWWSIGIVIALGWFTYGYRVFRGKVTGDYAH
jgi:cytochrome d ubiquinol oxidase subunit II